MTALGRIARGLAGLLLSTSLAGCALLSRGSAMTIHWYDPEAALPRLHGAALCEGGSSGPGALEVELGRVSAGINLRERIAYRDDTFDVGYYDDKRWTERPDAYVRRALARALFEERCVARVMGGPGPVLDVEVLAFEELRGPPRAARVRLRLIVHDDRDTFLERTISVVRPAPADRRGFDGVVQAMAAALDAAAEEIASLTEGALRARRAPAAHAGGS